MGAVATQPRRARAADAPAAKRSAHRLFEPGGATLEDSILGVWRRLASEDRADCPVCGGEMRISECCKGCGSELF